MLDTDFWLCLGTAPECKPVWSKWSKNLFFEIGYFYEGWDENWDFSGSW